MATQPEPGPDRIDPQAPPETPHLPDEPGQPQTPDETPGVPPDIDNPDVSPDEAPTLP